MECVQLILLSVYQQSPSSFYTYKRLEKKTLSDYYSHGKTGNSDHVENQMVSAILFANRHKTFAEI